MTRIKHPAKSFLLVSLLSMSQASFAVQPLSDDEMSDAVVLDPWGATAAGQPIDTTLSAREESASNADEANLALANDPNAKSEIKAIVSQYILNTPSMEHDAQDYKDGIQIQTRGTVDNVYVDRIFDNTGANRGSRAFEGINVSSQATIYNIR
jgi:hypothetical protein